MKDLKNLTSDPEKRKVVIADCAKLVDSEVKSKSGLTGMAVKAAFAVVKALKPNIVEELVDSLLDEFVDVIQPYYQKYQEEGSPGTLEQYLTARSSAVANSLLSITDKRSERAKTKVLISAYQKLRPKAQIHVEQAMPGIGRLLDKHVVI